MPNNQPLLLDIGEGLSIMLGLPTIASWNQKNKPKKAKLGTFGFNIQTNCLEYWDGKNWLEANMDKA